ncbi:MAG TPA: ferritin-like domain-containing protein [Ktedonobacterales bacterium]
MADERAGERLPDSERAENLLRTSALFRATSTRRAFMTRLMAVGGGVALGAGVGGGLLLQSGRSVAHAATDPVIEFGNAAVGAERIAVAFYANALGESSPYGVASDEAMGTLLNSAHRMYFSAARGQEQTHQDTLVNLGLSFPYSVFRFPAGTFGGASAMLAFGEALENIFIGAYLGAIKAAAAETNTFIAEAAAQILGVECEHRVLIRDIAGDNPPNNRLFEGDLSSNGSTVYATAADAVNALLALGITPVK